VRADGEVVWFEIDVTTATTEVHGDSPPALEAHHSVV
jgi:hypothetical protein